MKKHAASNPKIEHSKFEGRRKVALLGFGTVGRAVATIISERAHLGIELTHILNRDVARKKADWLPSAQWTEKIEDIVSSDAEIVVEVMGGLRPTGDYIRTLLRSGKSVVTANKQLIARDGRELIALARQNGQEIYYGASVAGGIPVISGLQNGLAGDQLLRIRGILNGTCNYILSEMEKKKVAFAEALSAAQRLGFAEADPTEDVDGLDARAKLAILVRIGLRRSVDPAKIAAQSIRPIEAIDFEYANQLGCTIRQISRAELVSEATAGPTPDVGRSDEPEAGVLFASVGPALVELSSPLARVEGSQNLVAATGIYGGETTFGGHGAGGGPTAVAIVSDILAIARSKRVETVDEQFGDESNNGVEQTLAVRNDFGTKHYLRFYVDDQPGIIASLATILARNAINIDAVLQMPGHPERKLPFLITLQECQSSLVEQALKQINKLEFMVEPCLHLPII